MSEIAKTVLVVDDSESVRRMLEWILQSVGMRFLEAADGRTAVGILERERVDLSIIDLNMPGMDGIRLIRKIRSVPATREMPILMLTTEGRQQDMKLAYDAGADMYLVKPSPPDVIRYKVLSLLGLGDPSQSGATPDVRG